MRKSLFDMLRQALTLTETSQRNQALLKGLKSQQRLPPAVDVKNDDEEEKK